MQSRVQLQSKLITLMGHRPLPLSRAERAAADWALVDDHQAVLDLSCGQGHLLAHFTAHHKLRACGMCHDPLQAQALRESLDGGEVMYAAGVQIPWQDASFDRVLLTRQLPSHIEPLELSREVLRVLKPGGKMLCVASGLPFGRLLTLPCLKAGRPLSLDRDELLHALEREGFVDVTIRQSRPGCWVVMGLKAS